MLVAGIIPWVKSNAFFPQRANSVPFASTDRMALHSDLASLCLSSLPEWVIVLAPKVNAKAVYGNRKHMFVFSYHLPSYFSLIPAMLCD